MSTGKRSILNRGSKKIKTREMFILGKKKKTKHVKSAEGGGEKTQCNIIKKLISLSKMESDKLTRSHLGHD